MSETIFINVDEAAKIIEADKQKAVDSYRTALKKKIDDKEIYLLSIFKDDSDRAIIEKIFNETRKLI